MNPDEEHAKYYKENPQGNHMMSPETKEKLNSIEQDLKEVRNELAQQDIKAAERSKDIEFIKSTLSRIETTLMKVIEDKKEDHELIWQEIKPMRDWQIKIGAKIAVYAGMGTFISGIASSLLVWYLTK